MVLENHDAIQLYKCKTGCETTEVFNFYLTVCKHIPRPRSHSGTAGYGVAYSGDLHPIYEDVGGTGGEDGSVACDAAMRSPTVSLAVNGNAVDEHIGAGPGGWA